MGRCTIWGSGGQFRGYIAVRGGLACWQGIALEGFSEGFAGSYIVRELCYSGSVFIFLPALLFLFFLISAMAAAGPLVAVTLAVVVVLVESSLLVGVVCMVGSVVTK